VKAAEMRLMHTIDPKAVVVLKKIHADIWNLANNHIMDVGPDGLSMTLEEAARAGALTIGADMDLEKAKRPVILDEAGGIGMFGVGYQRGCKPAGPDKAGCLSWSDMDAIEEVIRDIKKKCRWCVVVAHGGEEFTSLPNPYTRDRYLKFLELGADVVVAHHPHVPENYELFDNGKAIFYSLGNFIFDTNYQRVHQYTDVGVLLKLIFTEEKLDFEATGLQIVRGDERIDVAPLPDIFTDVCEEEYRLLAPLNAKAFDTENRRTLCYLEPERFTNAPEEVWNAYYNSTEPDGYYEGEHMDFHIIAPFAATAAEGAWKRSTLEKVKQYILRQL
jgi:poly-gamma-glutamate synthesis protein (capsule biosynthesis protein)